MRSSTSGKSGRPVGAGFSRSKVGKSKGARSMPAAGKARPARGSKLRTARPKGGAAAGRGY